MSANPYATASKLLSQRASPQPQEEDEPGRLLKFASNPLGETLHYANAALDATGKYAGRPIAGAAITAAAWDNPVGQAIRSMAEENRQGTPLLDFNVFGHNVSDMARIGRVNLLTVNPLGPLADLIAPDSQEEMEAIQDVSNLTAAFRERGKNLNAGEQIALEVLSDPSTYITAGLVARLIKLRPVAVAAAKSPELYNALKSAEVVAGYFERLQALPITRGMEILKVPVQTFEAFRTGLTGVPYSLKEEAASSKLVQASRGLDQAIRNLFGQDVSTTGQPRTRGGRGVTNLTGALSERQAIEIINELNAAAGDQARTDAILSELNPNQIADLMKYMVGNPPPTAAAAGAATPGAPPGMTPPGTTINPWVMPPGAPLPTPGPAPAPAGAWAMPAGTPITVPGAATPTPAPTTPFDLAAAREARTSLDAETAATATVAPEVTVPAALDSAALATQDVGVVKKALSDAGFLTTPAQKSAFTRRWNKIANNNFIAERPDAWQELIDETMGTVTTPPIAEVPTAAAPQGPVTLPTAAYPATVDSVVKELIDNSLLDPSLEQTFRANWQAMEDIAPANDPEAREAYLDDLIEGFARPFNPEQAKVVLEWTARDGRQMYELTREEFMDELRAGRGAGLGWSDTAGGQAQVRSSGDWWAQSYHDSARENLGEVPAGVTIWGGTYDKSIGYKGDADKDKFDMVVGLGRARGGWRLDTMGSDSSLSGGKKARAALAMAKALDDFNITAVSGTLSPYSGPLTHRAMVTRAVEHGAYIPQDVLDDYPNLKGLYARTEKNPNARDTMRKEYDDLVNADTEYRTGGSGDSQDYTDDADDSWESEYEEIDTAFPRFGNEDVMAEPAAREFAERMLDTLPEYRGYDGQLRETFINDMIGQLEYEASADLYNNIRGELFYGRRDFQNLPLEQQDREIYRNILEQFSVEPPVPIHRLDDIPPAQLEAHNRAYMNAWGVYSENARELQGVLNRRSEIENELSQSHPDWAGINEESRAEMITDEMNRRLGHPVPDMPMDYDNARAEAIRTIHTVPDFDSLSTAEMRGQIQNLLTLLIGQPIELRETVTRELAERIPNFNQMSTYDQNVLVGQGILQRAGVPVGRQLSLSNLPPIARAGARQTDDQQRAIDELTAAVMRPSDPYESAYRAGNRRSSLAQAPLDRREIALEAKRLTDNLPMFRDPNARSGQAYYNMDRDIRIAIDNNLQRGFREAATYNVSMTNPNFRNLSPRDQELVINEEILRMAGNPHLGQSGMSFVQEPTAADMLSVHRLAQADTPNISDIEYLSEDALRHYVVNTLDRVSNGTIRTWPMMRQDGMIEAEYQRLSAIRDEARAVRNAPRDTTVIDHSRQASGYAWQRADTELSQTDGWYDRDFTAREEMVYRRALEIDDRLNAAQGVATTPGTTPHPRDVAAASNIVALDFGRTVDREATRQIRERLAAMPLPAGLDTMDDTTLRYIVEGRHRQVTGGTFDRLRDFEQENLVNYETNRLRDALRRTPTRREFERTPTFTPGELPPGRVSMSPETRREIETELRESVDGFGSLEAPTRLRMIQHRFETPQGQLSDLLTDEELRFIAGVQLYDDFEPNVFANFSPETQTSLIDGRVRNLRSGNMPLRSELRYADEEEEQMLRFMGRRGKRQRTADPTGGVIDRQVTANLGLGQLADDITAVGREARRVTSLAQSDTDRYRAARELAGELEGWDSYSDELRDALITLRTKQNSRAQARTARIQPIERGTTTETAAWRTAMQQQRVSLAEFDAIMKAESDLTREIPNFAVSSETMRDNLIKHRVHRDNPGINLDRFEQAATAARVTPDTPGLRTTPSLVEGVVNGEHRDRYIMKLRRVLIESGATQEQADLAEILSDQVVAAIARRSTAFPDTEALYAIQDIRFGGSGRNALNGQDVQGTFGVFGGGSVPGTDPATRAEFTRTVIKMFDLSNPNMTGDPISAFVTYGHELSHFIQHMLPEDELAAMYRAIGATPGVPLTPEQGEMFASGWETYFRSGKLEERMRKNAALSGRADDAKILQAYMRISNFFRGIWQQVIRPLFRQDPANSDLIKWYDNFFNSRAVTTRSGAGTNMARVLSGSAAEVTGRALSPEDALQARRATLSTPFQEQPKLAPATPTPGGTGDAAYNDVVAWLRRGGLVTDSPVASRVEAGATLPTTPTDLTALNVTHQKYLDKVTRAADDPAKLDRRLTNANANPETLRTIYDAIQAGHFGANTQNVIDAMERLGHVRSFAATTEPAFTGRFDAMRDAYNVVDRVRGLNEAPRADATIDNVVAQFVNGLGRPTPHAVQTTDLIKQAAAFDPDHFSARMMWQDPDARRSLEAALTAATPQQAKTHVVAMFNKMNLENSAWGIQHPSWTLRIAPKTKSTTQKGRLPTYQNSVHGSVVNDRDVEALQEALSHEDVRKFQEEYEAARLEVGAVLDKYAAAPDMDDTTTARDLVDAVKNGTITDPADKAKVQKFLKDFDMTEEAAEKIAARGVKNRAFHVTGTRPLESFTVRDAYLEKLLERHWNVKAAELGVDLKKSDKAFMKTMSWIPKAWREQALLSPRYHFANVLDMTVKSLIHGVNPVKNFGAKNFAEMLGMDSLPDAVFSTRNDRDLAQATNLVEYTSGRADTAWKSIPLIGRVADPVIKFNAVFARSVEDSFRQWGWMEATKDALRSMFPQFESDIRRMMPGGAGADLLTDLGKQGQDFTRAEGLSFSPQRLHAMAMQRGASANIANQLAETWSQMIRNASDEGVKMATNVHFDLMKSYKIEDTLMLKKLLPFHFFATRNIPFYLDTLASNPELVNAMMAYKDVSEQDRIRMGLPLSYRGYIPIGNEFIENILGPGKIFFNPLTAISIADQTKNLSMLTGENPYPVKDEDKHGLWDRRTLGDIIDRGGGLGISPAPWINIPLSIFGAYGAKDETMPVLRASGAVKAVTGRVLGREGYDLGETQAKKGIDWARSLPVIGTGKRVETHSGSRKFDILVVRRLAETMNTYIDQNPEMNPSQVRQQFEQASRDGPGNPLWDEAEKQVHRSEGARALRGFTIPVPTQAATEESLALESMKSNYPPGFLDYYYSKDTNFKRRAQETGSPLAAYSGFQYPRVEERSTDSGGGGGGGQKYDSSQLSKWGGEVWGPTKPYPYNQYEAMAGYLQWLSVNPDGFDGSRAPEAYFRQYGIIGG